MISYIIPNTILTQEYYKQTRLHLLKDSSIIKIIDYDNMPFKNAIVENVTIILKNSRPKDNHIVQAYKDSTIQRELISNTLQSKFKNQKNYVFNIYSNKLVDRIFDRQDYKTLGELCNVNQGIALKGDKSLSLRDSNESGTYCKLLDGRNINKYSIDWGGVFLDYDVNRIHSCKRKDIFETDEKLLFRRVSKSLIFTYDTNKYYALNTIVVVNKKEEVNINIKFLLALMNSKLMGYLYSNKFKSTKKIFSEIQARSIKDMPILFSTSTSFVKYVDRILTLKNDNPKASTKPLEEKIDQLVYQLYDLTDEEIAIVEEASN